MITCPCNLRGNMKPFVTVLVTGIALCGSPDSNVARANQVRVLSFNVWAEGGRAEVDAMVASGADIIAIQEGYSSTASMARLFDFNWSLLTRSQRGMSNGIVTRFPITEQYDNGVQLDMGPLGEGYIFGVHLTSCPYQPYELHPQAARLSCGTSINTGTMAGDVDEAIARASAARGNQIRTVLDEIAANVPAGKPVFLVGDFNEPSHLDWTQAAGPDGAALHTHDVAWPTSMAVVSAGFKDSYREIHPDETTTLGYTWTTLNSNPEVHDRIDFVYYKGDDLMPIDSILVGDRGSAGGVAADLVLANYPSDHRAVLTTFIVVPEPSGFVAAALGLFIILPRVLRNEGPGCPTGASVPGRSKLPFSFSRQRTCAPPTSGCGPVRRAL
jgi:hypothetical protein